VVHAEKGKMIPLERPVGAGLLKVISMGFLSGEGEAIMWRASCSTGRSSISLRMSAGAAFDYLVIDLPPGTGDVQMGLARMIPRTEVLVVTTPNKAAQAVAGRAADMARKGHIRVAGVIENMSAFTCGTARPTRSSVPVAAGVCRADRGAPGGLCAARCRSGQWW